ncbi:hypothetical protein [Winogradskyella sp.]|uniref:hypothetical protein n=1 Tax=Winogradskyella sp. TaxID=1883156 RepID=UPI0025EBD1AA|nr:hypothetical protein [Winogradskyella sp.]
MIYLKRLIFLLLIVSSCESYGRLTIEGDITNSLTEVSATEVCPNSDIVWTIQDSGNSNNLFGLNEKGHIVRNIDISNTKNIDWEDLTSDSDCNIYIGDFGNNSKKRETFRILKINHNDLINSSATAQIIEFTLPNKVESKDFEAFFLLNNSFYLISKENKKFSVFMVPNKIGKHKAILRSNYNLKGKGNKITSADISDDGKTIVLLNHDKLWKISNYQSDDFFSGDIEKRSFKHNSQKEGVCFKTNSKVLLTDERNESVGGNIYSFDID